MMIIIIIMVMIQMCGLTVCKEMMVVIVSKPGSINMTVVSTHRQSERERERR